jgi:hypothetical protein
MSNLVLYVTSRFGHPYNGTVCVRLFVKKERVGIFFLKPAACADDLWARHKATLRK